MHAAFTFWCAAGAALATCAAHVFLGGRLFARPLLDSTLARAPKQTVYYCWHLTTAALLVMAAAFAWAALDPAASAAAVIATAIAGAFLIVNVVQNIAMGNSFRRHPQWTFFTVTTTLGALALANG
ncbi:MAG: hypothetical protein HXY28_10425 [Hydrogenophilaceae bacterium]|jgi:hypothetical protein|nr:hypothetical protein [Hydrogenophilaceae bacterium]